MGFCFAAPSALGQGTASGGSFSSQGSVTGGGGVSSGGAFQLLGEVGRSASGTSSGGIFTVTTPPAGYFSIPLGDFELDILFTGGQVRISWPAEASVYRLESTSSFASNISWEPISIPAGQTSYTIQADQTARFFRLRNP